MSHPTPADIIAFWRDAGFERWYKKDEAFDAEIRRRFLTTWEAALAGERDHWQDSDDGALALLIVLDQFSRNMFRGDPRAFAADAKAREVADRAIARGVDQRIDRVMRQFVYLPFEHSENIADQQRCVALFKALGDAENLRYAEIHEDIIRRFGRFPHRNPVLGRATTAAEQEFLKAGGFAG
ncbi:MAG: DUF924 domain-containing protein [Xanthobacteraceae bacterium]|nr:DUF924 domain-containing protein [Xanthobacteraceae bacterium]